MKKLKIYDFSTSPTEAEGKLIALLAEYRAFVEKRLAQGSPYTWGNLIIPMEELDARVKEIWSPFDHRQAVMNDEAAREIHKRCEGLLSEFATDMGQNAALFDAYQELSAVPLSPEQKRAVENTLRDFRLTGVDLPVEKKVRFKDLKKRLKALQTDFENHLNDAENAWKKHVADETELAGLPASTIAGMKQDAEQAGFPAGYLISLKQDKYRVVMEHAANRELRLEFYQAWMTKASDQGLSPGKWDNAPLYEEILALRSEQAALLGFKNYAELSLATKMANSTREVMDFLEDLAARAKPFALREYAELSAFAKEKDGVDTIELWDITYYVERIKQEKWSVSEKEIREYFPLSRVLSGMFAIVQKLYGVSFQECTDISLWHKDARFFEVFSKTGDLLGGMYMDLYSRENKRGGAWMDEAVVRRRASTGEIILPVAYLNHNAEASADGTEPLFSHDDVQTLFHEFGHTLHHLLTAVEVAAVSGINGVEWDAVENPSQFMENFCWTKEGLELISGHYKTGGTLPDAIFEKMLQARNFGEGLATIRQVVFSLFDFRLYAEYDGGNASDVLRLWRKVFESIHPAPLAEWNRFPNAFAHIFAGGYAAGYYSYKWAEVISDDSFSPFIPEGGAIDWSVGRKFLDELLSRGGSRTAMENFIAFRGRKPSIEAHLKKYGFVE